MAFASSDRMDGSWAVAFLVSAGIVYEIIAAACSSPQTMHVNAPRRGPTLMLWVNIGAIQAVGFVLIAAVLDKRHRIPIFLGGSLALILMYCQYIYAYKAGMRDAEDGKEGTEDYGPALLTLGGGYA